MCHVTTSIKGSAQRPSALLLNQDVRSVAAAPQVLKPDKPHTYGLQKFTVLSSVAQRLMLVGVSLRRVPVACEEVAQVVMCWAPGGCAAHQDVVARNDQCRMNTP